MAHQAQVHNYAQSDAHNRQQVAQRLKPARQLSVFEQQLVASVDHKVQQPLFRVSVRALIVTDNKQEMTKRTGAVKASLAAFTVPKYQSLVVRFGSKLEIVNRYRLYLFTHRMPALLRRHDCILAASEISDLFTSLILKLPRLKTSLNRSVARCQHRCRLKTVLSWTYCSAKTTITVLLLHIGLTAVPSGSGTSILLAVPVTVRLPCCSLVLCKIFIMAKD